MTTQELFTELRRHGFVPAPKLGTSGIWSLAPRRSILTDPEKAKVEVILLGDQFTIGAPGMPVARHALTTLYQLSLVLLQHGAHAPSNETLRPDFFTLPDPKAKKARR